MNDPSGPARKARSFAAVLRELREARSLTQQELAAAAGLSVDAVSALERGRRTQPQPHTVRSLASALQLRDAEATALLSTLGRAGNGALEMPSRTLTSHPPPPPAIPVVGRDDEVAEIVAALRSAPGRLVTLTGPGGVGKTTVALLAAQTVVADHPGGAFFADLTDVTDPDDVLAVVALAAGTHADTVTGLGVHLAGAAVLLVLDNLERVAACAPQLVELLSACPGAVVLATSRVPLRVRREREIRIAPLDPAAAGRLFSERLTAAGARSPTTGGQDDDPVAQLCRRADGLPLAIELLAAAAARLGPQALLDRVDQSAELPVAGPRDLPARQRTMAATIEWSCRILGPAARRLFPRLAIVPGSFSLNTVDAIAAPDTADAVGALAELIEHSLVARSDAGQVARFRLLEPVRRYALETLEPTEREQVQRSVSQWALRTARELGARIRGRGDMTAVEQVEVDRGVLRLGYDQLVDARRHDDAAELLWSVWLPMWMNGHTREGFAWTERLREGDLSERGQARWLVARAGFNRVAANLFATAERAMRLAEQVDDASLAAEAAIFASAAALRLGDFDGSGALLAQAEAHVTQRLDVGNDVWAAVHVPIGRGDGALLRGDRSAAMRHWRSAAATAQEVDSGFSVAAVLAECAQAARSEGRLDDAAVMLAAADELGLQRHGHRRRAHLAGVAAAVAAELGDVASAQWWEGVAGPDAGPLDTDELREQFRELVRRADTVSGQD
ncbi:helix-turn-helix domain-containing protein [Frankia sp. QA3]|uniref:ATP-binding protein n=1 Tax=Frankia sp. QA3 TaxID=710111 RepID=UPI000269C11C|nr:helix-turn-helix domain-containing protein [Frankia sp. QA3]EIV92886.1 putative ATPase [Frankia sp. QA3]